jgi:hypothetical protein
MSVPTMTEQQIAEFEQSVTRLLQARWDTVKITDWAISAASGYGRFWESREHALSVINAKCRELNAEQRRVYNAALAAARRSSRRLQSAFDEIERDPLAFLHKAIGAKSNPRPRQ